MCSPFRSDSIDFFFKYVSIITHRFVTDRKCSAKDLDAFTCSIKY